MIRTFATLLGAAALAAPTLSHADDWHRAESEHFILFSEDSEAETRAFVQDLERLDEVLRLLTGVGAQDTPLPESSKVTVFRFGETRDMSALAAGNRVSGIGGFFIPRATGSVAFVPRQRDRRRTRDIGSSSSQMGLDPKGVLFHEYVHYFMYQHRDAPYPLWYSEGFAELFSNLEFEDDNFLIGEVPPWRSAALATLSIDLDETFDPPRTQSGWDYQARTYGHGWLIASHLNLNPERRGQMSTYMQAIARGARPMEAAREAFGDLDVLTRELEEFRQGRARTLRVPYAVAADPAVEVRALDAAEEARMELMMQSKIGVDEAEARSLVRTARQLAATYPQSAAVLLAAAEAELDARNYAEADTLAQQVLAIDPRSTEAAAFRAEAALRQSFAEPAQLMEARSRFAAANRMESDHAWPLYGYYLTYLLDDSQPIPDEAKLALESAFRYAPYDQDVRRALIHLLLTEDRAAEARVVGARFTVGNSGYACLLRSEFDRFQAGEREPLLERVRPRHPGDHMDEARQEAEEEAVEADIEAAGCSDED